MSVSDFYISVGIGEKFGQYTCLYLGTRAVDDLFNFMLPKLQENMPSFSEQFEGEFYGEVFSIVDVPESEYLFVYDLIMQACDELDSLKRHKAILETALQGDVRYLVA